MLTFVLRLWLPDRPGALGQVASRIGAVSGDVVGIDILERGGGQAIDELIVELDGPDEVLDTLLRELREVDGVRVEEIRSLGETGLHADPRLAALEALSELVCVDHEVQLLEQLVAAIRPLVRASWAAVVDIELSGDQVFAYDGEAPDGAWLRAYLAGSIAAGTGNGSGAEASDTAWAPLPASGLALVVGRQDMSFRARERREIALFARAIDSRRRELSRARSRANHPSVR